MSTMLAYLSVPTSVALIVYAAANDRALEEGETPITIRAFICEDLKVGGATCLSKIEGSPLNVMRMIGALADHGHDCLLSAER